MKHYLVTTDFSESAESVYAIIKEQVEQIGAENVRITLLHLIDAPLGYYSGDIGLSFENIEAIIKEMLAEAEKQLSEIVKKHFTGFKVNTLAKRSMRSIASEIVETADEEKADMIVIATHGRTGIPHLLIGSVAEKVVRLSKCPVIVVPSRSEG